MFDSKNVFIICKEKAMYLYGFDKFAGSDKVFMCEDKSCPHKPGDIVADGDAIFLVIGEEICFSEQYRTVYKSYTTWTLVEKAFFSAHQLALLHHIVQTYYSTYKAVMRLLLPPMDVTALLSYKKSTKTPKHTPTVRDATKSLFVQSWSQKTGQQLIVIPDLWTGYNLFDDAVLQDATIWHSGLSALQMTKIFRWCKQGQIGTIITTFAGIFHDRKNLTDVLFVQPHKRYYQHQQDPRYKVPEVVDFIATQTAANLVKWE